MFYFVGFPLTISIECLHERRIRSSCELLAAKAFAYHLVVAHDDSQLAAEAGGEERTVFGGQLHEACVLLVAHEEQIADDRQAPGAGRQLAQLAIVSQQPLQQADQRQEAEEDQQQMLCVLLLHLQLAQHKLYQIRIG